MQCEGGKVTLIFSSRNRSTLVSGLLHLGVIALALLVSRVKPEPLPKIPDTDPVRVYVPHDLVNTPHVSHNLGGGGGGGDPTPASKGPLPRVALRQFTPPTAVIRNYHPELAVEPTLIGTPPQILTSMPSLAYGDPKGVNGPPSNGPGSDGGIGGGKHGGIGDNDGPGYGDGDKVGVDGLSAHFVGSTVPPYLLTKVDPEYTDEARQAKVQGYILIHMEVDTKGRPQNIRVVQGLGLGLDERAKEAVSKWTFSPGTVNGKPVVTTATIQVTFRLL